MKCPTNEQLAQAALDPSAKQDLAEHLSLCPACREVAASMGAIVDQLAGIHDQLNSGEDAARLRLLQTLSAERQDARPRSLKPTPWSGGFTMRQQAAFATMLVLVVLGVIFFWPQNKANSLNAMDEMATNLRKATSYRFVIRHSSEIPGPPGEPSVPVEMIATAYWQAPGSFRMESKSKQFGREQERAQIFPHGQAGIDIDHTAKRYRRLPARRGHTSPLMMVDKLSNFSGEANRELGARMIDGKKAKGFEIDSKRIDPDGFQGPVEVWLDIETKLPLEVRYEVKTAGMPSAVVMQMEQFAWNVELASTLFEIKPPAGYADATPAPPTTEEKVKQITTALKIYAEICGGNYPRVKMVYGDVTRDDMMDHAGIQGRPTPEQIRSDNYSKIMKATRGFAQLNGLLRDDPTSVYHGRTVTPADSNKVLIRWKTASNDYQVIYGNLKSESVSAKRLKELESDD